MSRDFAYPLWWLILYSCFTVNKIEKTHHYFLRSADGNQKTIEMAGILREK